MADNRFSYEGMKALSETVFRRYGYSEEEAREITDVLLTADLFGIESHGCQRMTLYTNGITRIGRIKRDRKPEVVRETPVSALIDAHEYIGQVAAMMATRLAIEKAKKTGVGIVCVKNSNHYGIAGYYARMIAREHLLGVSMTNTEAIMIPTNGRQALLGTNPIAVGMPAEPYPFLFDAATTVVPRGKVEVYAKKGLEIPADWAMDSEGKTSTLPRRVLDDIGKKQGGGILPLGGAREQFGSHKGYGFGMIVEIMTGILAGGVTSDEIRKRFDCDRCSHFFLAVDYGMFGDREETERRLSAYLNKLRESQTAQGAPCVYTHGQKEVLACEENLRRGIYLNDKTLEEITALCRELGLPPETYLIPVPQEAPEG